MVNSKKINSIYKAEEKDWRVRQNRMRTKLDTLPLNCQYITDFELQDFDFGTFLLQIAANIPNVNFITSAHFNL